MAPNNGDSFLCTLVYGSTTTQKRLQLFSVLQEMRKSINSPWILLGDFNCVANLDERIGSPVRLAEVQPLRDCMAVCNVHDLKHYGRFFTWTNKQTGANRVMSKIYRVMGNDQWEVSFPNSLVHFLVEGEYDHSPMLVSFSEVQPTKKPF